MLNKDGYKSKWYKDWFGEEYLSVYAHRNLLEAKNLIDLIEKELPLNKSDRILDIACGNARHAKLLARKRYHIFGTDLSLTLLKAAVLHKPNRAYPFLTQSDMRHLPLKNGFDVALSLFTSFGYFRSETMNRQVINEFARILNKGGRLAIDFLNPDQVIANLEPVSERIAGQLNIKEERWIIENRVYKQITINNDKTFSESVRLYTYNELIEMISAAGLHVFKTFGDYQGREYHRDSNRMILFARKE
ncbi:MAG: class I SAM-dependent methyltransferase [Calditrichaceae bacterium]